MAIETCPSCENTAEQLPRGCCNLPGFHSLAGGSAGLTSLRVHEGEDWPVPDGATFRRIGWLDQRGSVYLEIPPMGAVAQPAGSLTPLLIQLED